MGKQIWKPGNMLYPLPAVMVSTGDAQGSTNILTVAWTGTICTNPAMVYISVRPERYSYAMLRESGEFVINLTTVGLVRAADFCGVRSGRELDKFAHCGLTPVPASEVSAPLIEQSPLSLECRVKQILPLGSHEMFLSEIVAVDVDEQLVDREGKLHLSRAGLAAYAHGEYFALGERLGTFGFSVRKKPPRKQAGRRAR